MTEPKKQSSGKRDHDKEQKHNQGDKNGGNRGSSQGGGAKK